MKLRISAIIAAIGIIASACENKSDCIQNGDLLFVGLPMDYSIGGMASAIADATGSGETNYIHTAILEVDGEGAVWIIDATIKHGVDRHPLDTFLVDFTLNDGTLPRLDVMRLKDNSRAGEYVQNAKKFLGEEYDKWFMEGNGMHYCTELVYDSYVHDGEHVFETVPMNFKNAEGEFPKYWVELFSLIDAPIPQDEPGTNPQQMRFSPALEEVNVVISKDF